MAFTRIIYGGDRTPGDSAVPATPAAADSSSAGTIQPVGTQSRLDLGPGEESLLFDSRFIEKSYALYPDEVFRLVPAFMLGDSLGNGYPRRFSPLGCGFGATGVSLDGMPLNDPLTGAVDWRMIAPEILDQAAVCYGGTGSGYEGWTDEVSLGSLTAAPSQPVSRMGIAGGAYSVNKVSGGLRRRMFGSGGIHVQINKIQQNTEDFASKVEHIQYYTRLEQKIGRLGVVSADGLFFSNDQRSPAARKQRTTATHFQAALASAAGGRRGYRLAYNYASSHQPFVWGAGKIGAGAVSHGLSGQAWYSPGRRVKLGARLDNSSTSPRDFPADSVRDDSRRSTLIAGSLSFEPTDSLVLDFTAGTRSFSGGQTRPVGSAGFRAGLRHGQSIGISWRREALAPSLAAMIGRFRAVEGPEKVSPAGVDHLAADWQIRLGGGRSFQAGIFRRRAGDLVFTPNAPEPLADPWWRMLDFTADGLSWSLSGPLFRGLEFTASGIELFGQPRKVPYLPGRRLMAVLSGEGRLYAGDLGWSLRAEMTYEGAFRFPVSADPAVGLLLQKERVNFGGSASLRIIDFVFYVRADYLLSDYYNGIDPLSLPGPRGVFGVHWLFFN